MENIFIDKLATKRFHKELDKIENIEDIFKLLMEQIEKEEE
jgi:hypothetical protein